MHVFRSTFLGPVRRAAGAARTSLCAAALLVGCGADDPTRAAQAAFARGDVDGAAALLSGVEGPAADALRKSIAHEQARRELMLARVDDVLGEIPDASLVVVKNKLQALRADSSDRFVRAEIDRTLSKLGELYADAKRAPRSADWFDEARGDVATTRPDAQAGAPERTERDATERIERDAPEWDPYERAGNEPRSATQDAPAAPAAPPELAASEPESSEPLVDVQPESIAAPGARKLLTQARERLRADDLAGARDAYLSAAAAASYGLEREEYAGLARDVSDRMQLRDELGGAIAAEPAPFEALGITAIEPDRVRRDGEDVPWRELPIEPIEDCAALVALSGRASVGLVHERLARRDVARAWNDLNDLWRSGRVDADTVADVVARWRNERVPEGGYVLRGDDWIARSELEARTRDARVEKLDERFEKARFGRPEDLAAIAAEYRADGADAELGLAIAARFAAVAGELSKDPTTRRLDRLAEDRDALDAARAAALALIFDEEQYFYPYTPPECPPDKAAKYAGVQRRVDELVAAVRAIWKRGERVSLGKEFQRLEAEIAWLRSSAVELQAELDATLLPRWFDGLPSGAGEVSLREFAWTAAEADALAHDRAVSAYDERVWAAARPADVPEAEPSSGEQRQVEITNEYRVMMGRAALAWNPRIQAAARDHSDYMSRTGDFGHFEPSPETKDPMARMTRRGYDHGRSENCAMTGGPESAHEGWLHSSGHHRNLLVPGHREMASAAAGPYWTQNFGGGGDFESEL